MLGADIEVVIVVVIESIFSVCVRFVSMPSISDYTLYFIGFKQMGNPCAVVSRIQPHILWQFSNPLLDFFEYFRHGRNVVDVRRFYMYIHNHIMHTVYRAMLAVMESIRFTFSRLLTTLRIRRAFHFGRRSAALGFIVIAAEWFLSEYFSVPIYLRVQ